MMGSEFDREEQLQREQEYQNKQMALLVAMILQNKRSLYLSPQEREKFIQQLTLSLSEGSQEGAWMKIEKELERFFELEDAEMYRIREEALQLPVSVEFLSKEELIHRLREVQMQQLEDKLEEQMHEKKKAEEEKARQQKEEHEKEKKVEREQEEEEKKKEKVTQVEVMVAAPIATKLWSIVIDGPKPNAGHENSLEELLEDMLKNGHYSAIEMMSISIMILLLRLLETRYPRMSMEQKVSIIGDFFESHDLPLPPGIRFEQVQPSHRMAPVIFNSPAGRKGWLAHGSTAAPAPSKPSVSQPDSTLNPSAPFPDFQNSDAVQRAPETSPDAPPEGQAVEGYQLREEENPAPEGHPNPTPASGVQEGETEGQPDGRTEGEGVPKATHRPANKTPSASSRRSAFNPTPFDIRNGPRPPREG